MNRRNSIKGILGLGAIGVFSFSIFKWIDLHRSVDIETLTAYKELIADLAETIIPATNTPGAKEAGVDHFIINALLNCTGKVEQNKFVNGLKDLEVYTRQEYGKQFSACLEDEKIKILAHFERKENYSYVILNKVSNKILGKSFFKQLKNLTVEGYCMSELGATKGLAYDYIPVLFESCVPLTPHQKSWATK